ncbi:putative ABC transporter permease [uncultured Faecalibaculum sp.]|uniref:putative ABC transporter permease n=1 Tax=uncultured Faecalibaculum sp. TaxID=1729681 RepID=UPI002629C829|nr:hypothetical protein [uncultured Faecalibaculum sp.]
METFLINCLHAYFYFMVYSFGGWVVQGLYVGAKDFRFVNTGFFHGPYVPIFGFGCLFIIYIVDRLSMNPFWVFVNTFWLTSVLEYITSWYLQKRYHRLWWDYSKHKFNIHGRVCLLNSTLYGVAGLVVTYVFQPWMEDLVAHIPLHAMQGIMILFTIVFGIDFITTNREMGRHKKALEQLHAHVQRAVGSVAYQDENFAAAVASLQKMQENSRHMRGFVHQRLDEAYQSSVDRVNRHVQEAGRRMQDAQSAVNARVQEAGARVQQAQEMVESHVQEVSQRVNALRQERDKPASGANGKAASEEAGAGKEDAKQAE